MAAYVFHVYRGEGLSSSINLSSGQTVHLKALGDMQYQLLAENGSLINNPEFIIKGNDLWILKEGVSEPLLIIEDHAITAYQGGFISDASQLTVFETANQSFATLPEGAPQAALQASQVQTSSILLPSLGIATAVGAIGLSAAGGSDKNDADTKAQTPANPNTPNTPNTPNALVSKVTFEKITGDNLIDTAEAAQKQMIVGKVSHMQDGAEVVLNIGGNHYRAQLQNGGFSFEVDGATLSNHSQISATVKGTQTNGQSATVSGSQDYRLMPSISIDDVTQDNVVNIEESAGNITVSGKIKGLLIEDAIKITCGCVACVATRDQIKIDNEGNFTVDFAGSGVVQGDKVKVEIMDKDTTKLAEESKTYQVDLQAPQISISLNAIGSGKLSQEQLSKTFVINGAYQVQAEDLADLQIELSIGSNIYSSAGLNPKVIINESDKTFRLEVDGAVLRGQQKVSASIKALDKAGNPTTQTTEQPYEIDASQIEPSITVAAVDDGLINANDLNKSVIIRGVYAHDEYAALDPFKIEVYKNNVLLGQATPHATDNTWQLTLQGKDLAGAEGDNRIHAVIRVDGKTAQSLPLTYQVDTQLEASVQIESIAGDDNRVSVAEIAQDVVVKGRIEGEFKQGDAVSIYAGTQRLGKSTVQTGGDFEVKIAGKSLYDLGDKTLVAAVEAHDQAGNSREVRSTAKSYHIEIPGRTLNVAFDDITGDNFINAHEAKQNITLSGTISNAQEGEKISLIVGKQSVTATVEAGGRFTSHINGSAFVEAGAGSLRAQVDGALVTGEKVFTVADNAQAKIEILSIGKDGKGIIGFSNGENVVRISGTLEVFDQQFSIGRNIGRIKSITLNIGDKKYEAGINEENQTFFADIKAEDLIAANGKKISYSIEAADKYYNLEESYYSGYSKVANLKAAGELTEDNTNIHLEKNVYLTGDAQNGYRINSAALKESLYTEVHGKISGAAVKASDSVNLAIAGNTYKAQVNNDLSFTAKIDTADLQGRGEKGLAKIQATVESQNAAGETVTVSSSEYAALASAANGAMQHHSGRLKHFNDLPYFMQVLDIEHYKESYGYRYAIGERLEKYEFGNPNGTKIISYSFGSYGDSVKVNNKSETNTRFTAGNQAIVREVLKTFEDYIDVKFVEKPYVRDADFGFYLVNLNNGDISKGATLGFATFGGDVVISNEVYGDNGRIVGRDRDNNVIRQGSLNSKDGWVTVAHELMHTFGMTHPFRGFPENSTPYKTSLKFSEDESLGVTLLSYESAHDFVGSQDLRLFDLAYLHYRFGVSQNARKGNDTYGFKTFNQSSADNDIYIWDGGGVDTFDASQEKNGVYVNLTPGSRSYNGKHLPAWNEFDTWLAQLDRSKFGVIRNFASNKADYFGVGRTANDHLLVAEIVNNRAKLISSYNGQPLEVPEDYDFTDDQVFIGYNTQIENLKGSAFNDILFGNNAANHIEGGAGNDRIDGGAGDDYIDGGIGADVMLGGVGNDIFIVDNKDDEVIEYAGQGRDKVLSSVDYRLSDHVEDLQLLTGASEGIGNNEDNHLIGNSADNRLEGRDGDDILEGRSGNDILLGGLGKDTFVFNTELDGSITKIEDFTVGEDIISLSKSVFASLTDNTMSNWNDYVFYDKASGALSYDADGSGHADAIHFATLSLNLNLDNNSFIVV